VFLPAVLSVAAWAESAVITGAGVAGRTVSFLITGVSEAGLEGVSVLALRMVSAAGLMLSPIGFCEKEGIAQQTHINKHDMLMIVFRFRARHNTFAWADGMIVRLV
jgi:hypothetical protein